MIHRMTDFEAQTIRAYAMSAAGRRNVVLEAGVRCNIEDDSLHPSVNIRLVDPDPAWENSDLCGFMSWTELKRGFPLTEDGSAEIDIYVYSTGVDGELETNVQAIWEGGRLARMEQTAGPALSIDPTQGD